MGEIITYEEAARSIHLNLKEFCDESKPYPEMIADAARKASSRLLKMQEALEIHQMYNKLHNDKDAYLYDIIEWAFFDGRKPQPEWFGLES